MNCVRLIGLESGRDYATAFEFLQALDGRGAAPAELTLS
jgi:hypothetical protein